LLTNPGFESPGTLPTTDPGVGGGWYQFAYGGTVKIVKNNPHSGSYAAEMDVTSSGANILELNQDIKLPVEQDETVTFWAKTLGNSGTGLFVDLDDVNVTGPLFLTTTYKEYTYTVLPTDFGQETLSFSFDGLQGATAFIDDVSVTPAPDGGLTVALLGGALLGLGALRRKLFRNIA